MENLYFGILDSTTAVAGFLLLLAVALGGILLGYVAEEEAKGRRLEWLEEPLAAPGEFEEPARMPLRKAA
jgi:hypothetical protein